MLACLCMTLAGWHTSEAIPWEDGLAFSRRRLSDLHEIHGTFYSHRRHRAIYIRTFTAPFTTIEDTKRSTYRQRASQGGTAEYGSRTSRHVCAERVMSAGRTNSSFLSSAFVWVLASLQLLKNISIFLFLAVFLATQPPVWLRRAPPHRWLCGFAERRR